MDISNLSSAILYNSNQIQDLTDKIASGSKYAKGSESPTDYNQMLSVQSSIEKIEKVNKDLDYAVNYMTVSENAIFSIQDNLEQIRTDMIFMGNNNFSDEDNKIVLDRMINIKEQLLATANTRTDGQYIFSGTLSNEQAFSDDGTYNGNNIRKDAYINSNGIEKDYSITGQELFLDSDLLAMVDNIIALLEDTNAVVTNELKTLGTSYTKSAYEELEVMVAQEINDTHPKYSELQGTMDLFNQSVTDYIQNPTEENLATMEKYENILTNPEYTLTGPMSISNDETIVSNYSSNANGEYAFTIPIGMENITINLDDLGANDNFQLFDKAGNHLAGSSTLDNSNPASSIITNNPTLFNSDATYTDQIGANDNITHTVSSDSFEMPVGSGNMVGDEKITINKAHDEEMVLFIEGVGSFEISTSWTNNLGDILSEDTKEYISRIKDLAVFENDLANWHNETVDYDLKEEYHQKVLDSYDDLLYKEIKDSVTGEVTSTEPFDDLISTASEDLFNLASNPFSYKIERVENVRQHIQFLESRLGNEMNYIQNTNNLNETNRISLQLFLAEISDLDLAEASIELQDRTNSLEALYQITAKVQNLSLTNYL